MQPVSNDPSLPLKSDQRQLGNSFGSHRCKILIKKSVSVPPLVVFVDSDLKIKMRVKKDKLLE